MKEQYEVYKMRPITDALISAQHAITAMVVKGKDDNIFDYRTDNPELYKLYMEINEAVCHAFELYNN